MGSSRSGRCKSESESEFESSVAAPDVTKTHLVRLCRASGREVGKAMLFYGCHSRDTDLLYDDEMRVWERQGVVKVFHAFSRDSSASQECKYVQ